MVDRHRAEAPADPRPGPPAPGQPVVESRRLVVGLADAHGDVVAQRRADPPPAAVAHGVASSDVHGCPPVGNAVQGGRAEDQGQGIRWPAVCGAVGLLFDRDFGLVPRAAVYLLGFLGAARLWRARRGHGWELAALALGALLSFAYIADIAYWWADGSPPSRYLLSTVPLLAAAVACGFETILEASRARPALFALLGATVAWSVFVTLVFAIDSGLRYDLAVDIRESGNAGALFTYLGRLLRPEPGLFFPSLVRIDALSVALSVAWVAVSGALVLWGRWALHGSLRR